MSEWTANWTMPEWMEPYRRYIVVTGTPGRPLEDLVRSFGDADAEDDPNAAFASYSAVSQVALLTRLHGAGLL